MWSAGAERGGFGEAIFIVDSRLYQNPTIQSTVNKRPDKSSVPLHERGDFFTPRAEFATRPNLLH